MTYDIINPEIFGFRPSGWNHGMLSPAGGRILFVSGQIVPVGDFVAQWDGVLSTFERTAIMRDGALSLEPLLLVRDRIE